MGCTASLHIQETSYDIASNTSQVRVWIDYTQTGETWSGYTKSGYCWISTNGGGESAYGIATTLPKNSTKTGFDMTFTVTHKADGTGSVSARSELYTGLSPGTVSASNSLTLTTIPRATTPTLSAATVEMGKSITINLPRASSSFTHNVTYSFGSASGTISSNAGTSCTFTPALSLANQIPNVTSGTGTITVQTKNGSTVIGTKTVNFTATVPASVVPSISGIAITDPNNIANTYGGYVQTKSKVKIQVSASGAYSSTIKSVVIDNGIGGVSGANPFESNVITAAPGAKTVSVTVTDTRGRTATATAPYSVVAYSVPAITGFNTYRCNADGSANDSGGYIKIDYSGAVTNINNVNVNYKLFNVRYRSTGGNFVDLVNYSDAYSVASSLIVGASTESAYEVQFSIIDSYASTAKSNQVSTAFVLMDFHVNGKGVSIGGVSTGDGFSVKNMHASFEQYVNVNDLHSNVNLIANNVVQGNIVQGSRLQTTSGSASIWEDSEGGNIEIASGNGHTNRWQIDSAIGNLRAYTFREADGGHTEVTIDQYGTIHAPNFYCQNTGLYFSDLLSDFKWLYFGYITSAKNITTATQTICTGTATLAKGRWIIFGNLSCYNNSNSATLHINANGTNIVNWLKSNATVEKMTLLGDLAVGATANYTISITADSRGTLTINPYEQIVLGAIKIG